jgi:hypothetical protein
VYRAAQGGRRSTKSATGRGETTKSWSRTVVVTTPRIVVGRDGHFGGAGAAHRTSCAIKTCYTARAEPGTPQATCGSSTRWVGSVPNAQTHILGVSGETGVSDLFLRACCAVENDTGAESS